ncbi:thioredoxin family protein [Chitinophaga japonensis]|uniref:Thioredoxin-like protein n=1 Tax=Chitinophaga japonensis TaxID=104662 RepID=A0A562T051_CHIJA|nr:thioredoxin family protein [Chitinophaga japonensis]TWI86678.1 thioredoxin-like protein [Chitinophaga japonensis]
MKKFLILIVWMPLMLKAQSEKGIQFIAGLSWAQVQEKARSENKYIFLDAYATWCIPCKMMDREVYPHPAAGRAINEKFIAVRMQTDETSQDNETVRQWYADARKIKETYHITGLPCFLFFAPDGRLLHKDVGYRNVRDFIKLTELALDPQKPLFYAQLEAYKKDLKDYTTMGELAVFVKTMMNDTTTGYTIARDYKTYLDKQPVDSISKKTLLDFIGIFPDLVCSGDPFFRLCYYTPEKANQIKQRNGWANALVNQTITREEIDSKLRQKGKPIISHPDWNEIRTAIGSKYERIDIDKLVQDYQVEYYYELKDWTQWALYMDQKINANPPEGGMQSFFQLNIPAWNAFLHCNDSSVLTKALEWSDLSIQLKQPDEILQELDTRANLLYKLGRVKEAIAQEQKAIRLSEKIAEKEGRTKGPFWDEFVTTIDKMKKGVPTWPTK